MHLYVYVHILNLQMLFLRFLSWIFYILAVNNLYIIKLSMIMESQYNHCWPVQNADTYITFFLYVTYIKKYM